MTLQILVILQERVSFIFNKMSLEKIKKYFTPKTILDIGANVGQFYNQIKIVFPNAYYYLIEGNEKCEDAIKNLNVNYSICLLSDSIKEVDFFIRKNEQLCTGNSIYREKTTFFSDDQIEIVKKRTSTLESLFNEQTFDLIKIDTQGSEMDIIKGGLNVVSKAKGIILEISLIEYNEKSPTSEYVYSFMKNLGFEPVEHISDINHPITYELIQQDILFLNKKL